MSALVPVTMYTGPRDEDGSIDHFFKDDCEHAYRWWPEIESREDGRRLIHRLRTGDTLSEANVATLIAYLNEAIEWYRTLLPEPFDGRNDGAIEDMRNLIEELS